jgi:hypothetical protein
MSQKQRDQPSKALVSLLQNELADSSYFSGC